MTSASTGVVLPGLANGHSHTFHRALRGRTHDDGGNFWTWRDAMYGVTRKLDPETYHGLAKAVFAEMLLAGYTAVGEFHYVHHAPGGRRYDDPNVMGRAVVAAAREVGIRLTLLDTCYLAGGLTAGGHLELDDDPGALQRRLGAGVGRAGRRPRGRRDDPDRRRPSTRCAPSRATTSPPWGRSPSPTAGRCTCTSPSSPARTSRARASTAARRPSSSRARGCSDPSTTVVHATHLSDKDVELLAGADTHRLLLPHDRARPRRRHRPGPPPRRRGGAP